MDLACSNIRHVSVILFVGWSISVNDFDDSFFPHDTGEDDGNGKHNQNKEANHAKQGTTGGYADKKG